MDAFNRMWYLINGRQIGNVGLLSYLTSTPIAGDAFEGFVTFHPRPASCGLLLALDKRANLSFPQ